MHDLPTARLTSKGRERQLNLSPTARLLLQRLAEERAEKGDSGRSNGVAGIGVPRRATACSDKLHCRNRHMTSSFAGDDPPARTSIAEP